ncbi:protein phosphatase 1 regulatory subunit 16A-like isoform X3, partial [Vespula squamosa]
KRKEEESVGRDKNAVFSPVEKPPRFPRRMISNVVASKPHERVTKRNEKAVEAVVEAEEKQENTAVRTISI